MIWPKVKNLVQAAGYKIPRQKMPKLMHNVFHLPACLTNHSHKDHKPAHSHHYFYGAIIDHRSNVPFIVG